MNLKELQALGSLPADLVVCKKYAATVFSDLGNYSDEEKEKVQAVVLDNSIWVATPGRVAPVKASVVYSYDGERFGYWNRQNHTFSIMALENKSMVATKIISLMKEDTDMSETNFNDDLSKELEDAMKGAGAPTPSKIDMGKTPEVKAPLTDAQKAAKQAEAEAKRKQKDNMEAQAANVIKQLAAASAGKFTIDSKYIENNYKKGRFEGFFTATDPVVKVSLKQTPINTGTNADPKYELKDDAKPDQDTLKKFDNGKKNIGPKWLKCKSDIVFRQSGPSTVVAGIVKTPAMTEITDISELAEGKRQWNSDCAESNAFTVRVLPKEALYAYIELNYNKKIQEDESIPGHTELVVSQTEVKSKAAGTGSNEHKYRSRIKAAGRTLFTPGNFFPLETYDTAVIGSMTNDERELVNNNFAAIAKAQRTVGRDNAVKGEFSPEAAGMFSVDAAKSNPTTGLYVCTSSVVDGGTPVSVKPYNQTGKNATMVTVSALPIRAAKASKDGTSTTYPYSKSKYDEGANPAITRGEYQSFIARINSLSADTDFKSVVDKAITSKRTAARSSSSKRVASASERVTGLDIIAMRANKSVAVDGNAGNLNDIFEMFKSAAV